MQKHWLKIVAGCAVLVILLILLVPFFIDADTFRPTLETQLSTALGRPVTLTHLTFSL